MPVARRRLDHAAKTFKCWWRPQRGDQRWRLLCEASDYHTAWDQLLDRRPRVNGDLLVLPADHSP
jgi:hypothetical protein